METTNTILYPANTGNFVYRPSDSLKRMGLKYPLHPIYNTFGIVNIYICTGYDYTKMQGICSHIPERLQGAKKSLAWC
jgi:hypothetical protein